MCNYDRQMPWRHYRWRWQLTWEAAKVSKHRHALEKETKACPGASSTMDDSAIQHSCRLFRSPPSKHDPTRQAEPKRCSDRQGFRILFRQSIWRRPSHRRAKAGAYIARESSARIWRASSARIWRASSAWMIRLQACAESLCTIIWWELRCFEKKRMDLIRSSMCLIGM